MRTSAFHPSNSEKKQTKNKTAWNFSKGSVLFVAHLRQPVVLRSSKEDWNLTL